LHPPGRGGRHISGGRAANSASASLETGPLWWRACFHPHRPALLPAALAVARFRTEPACPFDKRLDMLGALSEVEGQAILALHREQARFLQFALMRLTWQTDRILIQFLHAQG